MSERTKNRILAVYLIWKTAGLQVSDSMEKTVADIERERTARAVARV